MDWGEGCVENELEPVFEGVVEREEGGGFSAPFVPNDEGEAGFMSVFCKDEPNCFWGDKARLGVSACFGVAEMLEPVDSRVVVEVLDGRRFSDRGNLPVSKHALKQCFGKAGERR